MYFSLLGETGNGKDKNQNKEFSQVLYSKNSSAFIF
jgi:hypothetical protein